MKAAAVTHNCIFVTRTLVKSHTCFAVVAADGKVVPLMATLVNLASD